MLCKCSVTCIPACLQNGQTQLFCAACFDLFSMISIVQVNGRGGITKHNNIFEGLMEPSLSCETFAFILDTN